MQKWILTDTEHTPPVHNDTTQGRFPAILWWGPCHLLLFPFWSLAAVETLVLCCRLNVHVNGIAWGAIGETLSESCRTESKMGFCSCFTFRTDYLPWLAPGKNYHCKQGIVKIYIVSPNRRTLAKHNKLWQQCCIVHVLEFKARKSRHIYIF